MIIMKPAYYSYTAATAIGSKDINRDALFFDGTAEQWHHFETKGRAECNKDAVLFAVFDGVGRKKGSARAAREMARCLERWNEFYDSKKTLEENLLYCISEGNDELFSYNVLNKGDALTTVAAVALQGDSYAYLNMGDSPVFQYKKRKLTPLSCSHFRQYFDDCDDLDICFLHKERGRRLTLAAGLRYAQSYTCPPIHTGSGTLQKGERLVLCTDGVTDALTLKEFLRYMKKGYSADRFVTAAADEPYSDNCTMIIVSPKEK